MESAGSCGLKRLARRMGMMAAALPLAASWALAEPYEAPAYTPPPPPQSRLHLIDNGNGTITDPDTRLMWAREDSYAALKRCLTWHDSVEYVRRLRVGGYADWRLPSLRELASIYDNTQENIMGWDGNEDYPLALDEKFASGAAYWYWSSDYDKTALTDCCARSMYFVNGMAHIRRFTMCENGGARAVRDAR